MRTRSLLLTLALCATLAASARADSTINATAAYAWGANLGWTNWRPSAAQGVSIGEYICSGYVYSANVGWINLGSGSPANAVQYQNNSGADWGVNYFPTNTPGVAILRGYAYAANIGWINFEGTGNASVNLLNGQLFGYAYSANAGWINLGSMTTYVVKTDAVAPGVDTDHDGIADAWELIHFGTLAAANGASDADGDGVSDQQEYLGATDPADDGAALRITSFARLVNKTLTLNLSFTSTPARLYRIETSPSLTNPVWTDAGYGNFLPDGATTARQLLGGSNPAKFYRVKALRFGL